MEMSVLYMLLVAGVIPTVSSDPYEYRLITDLKSWPDAQAYCREHYADLATVENDLHLGRIQTEAQRLGFTSEAWVGLYNDVNSWRCSRDEVPVGWTNWGMNQPNNRLGIEECTILTDAWYDYPCSSSYYFVCYDGTIRSTDKFVLYRTAKTFAEAQKYCRQRHTDLACPTNNIENTMIKNKFTSGLAWIGFYRDSWKWSDKANNSDIKWILSLPDNAGGNDNCGYVDQSVFSGGETSLGWFVDTDCSIQLAFFCQYVPKKRQVIRVVVQSDQDVNDPAVKAALLKKIQQTLMTRGMTAYAKLRWREQSDGRVFYKQKGGTSVNVRTC